MSTPNLTADGVRAVVFDISGTVLDYGCRGPGAAFVELFARHAVTVSTAEARGPMGTHKRATSGRFFPTPPLPRAGRPRTVVCPR